MYMDLSPSGLDGNKASLQIKFKQTKPYDVYKRLSLMWLVKSIDELILFLLLGI